ncbi:MAG TPA: TonB-dependent receptor [Flavisolibacter sp.]|nr:TonB-dependent receptor [Flavisolibacter sp.]
MRKSLILTAFILALVGPVLAQTKEIKGKIVDAITGAPIEGVSILTDKKASASTKSDGTYSIQVAASTKSLIISHVGYNSQTVEINNESTLDIRLQPSSSTMEDVVVIGYGTQKKSHLTGAVSKFKNEKLDEAPVARLDQALQGRIAGVQIQNIDPEAGADPRIRVRGTASINAGANPLVVVDGHPVPDGLSFVNPADVESVEVLKDAASAAIYGSRGASGVIIITTKSGKADRTRYNLKVNTGQRTAYALYPMMSMTEYGNLMFYEASLRAKDPSIPAQTPNQVMSGPERAGYVIENTLLGGQPTDWQREALRSAAVRNIQLNVSGGTSKSKYFISGAYQRDQGMMHHSEHDRMSIKAKLDLNLSKRVKLSLNVNPSYIKRERPGTNFTDFVRFYSFLPVYHTEATAAFVNQSPDWVNIKPGDFVQAAHFNNRIYSGMMPDGTMWSSGTAVVPFNTSNNTPKSMMENISNKSNEYRILSSADLTINILPGLDFKTLASVYASYTSGLNFEKTSARRQGTVNMGVYDDRLYTDLLSENTLNYSKKLGDHNFSVLAGFTTQKTRTVNQRITATDFPSDNITTLNTALQVSQDKNQTFNIRNQIGLNSVLGRVTYSYQNKYLVSASFRRDGSSYFAPGKKWGSFPAASLGWVASEEKFMKDIPWISQLKLRGSYGVTGNNNIVPFAFVDLLSPANYGLGSGVGTSNPGQAPSQGVLSNPNITWERTFQYNGGIDLTLFRNAISLSVDVYQSKTDQLLLQQSTMAFAGVTRFWNNIGRLQNRGIEVELTTNNIRGRDFKWSTTANIAHNRNKIVDLGGLDFLANPGGERNELYRNQVGGPLVQFFGWKTDGVWTSKAQVDSAIAAGLTASNNAWLAAGGLKVVDITGDNRIDDRDRTIIGNPYPDFTWGITNNITYKAFDLSFLFQGSQGGQLINGDPNYNEARRINKNYTANRWISPLYPGDGKTPYFTTGINWMWTDYVVEDASYYALREVIVGYTLPSKLAKLARINSMRVYFSAQNLYYHFADSYRGVNPEARLTTGDFYNTPLIDGYQRGSFPIPKTYLFGIDISF